MAARGKFKFKFIHAGFCVRFNYELLYGFNAIVYMVTPCKSISLFVGFAGGVGAISCQYFFQNATKKFHAQIDEEEAFFAKSSKFT